MYLSQGSSARLCDAIQHMPGAGTTSMHGSCIRCQYESCKRDVDTTIWDAGGRALDDAA